MLAMLAMLAMALGACEASVVDSDRLRYEETQAGDTTVIISYGAPPEYRLDPEIVWRSDELEWSRRLLLTDELAVIADRNRVHLVPRSGGEVRSIGREGEGPGEFRWTSAVGIRGADTLVVLDSGLQRLTVFSLDGELVRTERLPRPHPFVNPLPGPHHLRPAEDGYYMFWRSNLSLPEPTPVGLIRHDLRDGSHEVLRSWPDLHFQAIGTQWVTSVEVFTPRAYVAMSDAELIHGDGIHYCLIREPLPTPDNGDRPVVRFCRDWTRVEPGPAIRNPDVSRAEPGSQNILEEIFKVVPVPDHLPSFDAALLDQVGRVWVRTMGPEMAQVHPRMESVTPELVPARRNWDVFGTDARLVATVTLPVEFDPRAISEAEVWGFLELVSGEVVVASAALPTALR